MKIRGKVIRKSYNLAAGTALDGTRSLMVPTFLDFIGVF